MHFTVLVHMVHQYSDRHGESGIMKKEIEALNENARLLAPKKRRKTCDAALHFSMLRLKSFVTYTCIEKRQRGSDLARFKQIKPPATNRRENKKVDPYNTSLMFLLI